MRVNAVDNSSGFLTGLWGKKDPNKNRKNKQTKQKNEVDGFSMWKNELQVIFQCLIRSVFIDCWCYTDLCRSILASHIHYVSLMQ